MDWTSSLIKSIEYIENHLLDSITVDEVSKEVSISSYYFQKSFLIYTGYSVGEYIRSRRLYLAALDIRNTKEKIINIALKYGYETPEAFSKAFSRFHNATPREIRNSKKAPKPFLPLSIHISIQGGNIMDYKIEKEDELVFIGFKKTISEGEGYKECPKFWDEISNKYFSKISDDSEVSNAIKTNMIGSFAICLNDSQHSFNYFICGRYVGGKVPSNMELVKLPSSTWAKFRCVGPLPGALQSVNEQIWKDWIPNNKKYQLAFEADVEYYSNGNTQSEDYVSEIWLPVKENK